MIELKLHRRPLLATSLACTLFVAIACTGPEERGAVDPTFTPTITPSPTATFTPTPSPTPEPTATPSPTPEPSPTATATTPPATPTVATSPTADSKATVEITPTEEPAGLESELATLEDLNASGYELLEEGTRSAQELANAYSDPGAHMQRLQDWGFQQHVFRSFLRPAGNEGDPEPDFILMTINEYGDPDLADEALTWLFRLGTTQGATEADAPDVGDRAVAITVATSDGQPTASVYVRREQFVYIFFAQGGDPLPMVSGMAERIFNR